MLRLYSTTDVKSARLSGGYALRYRPTDENGDPIPLPTNASSNENALLEHSTTSQPYNFSRETHNAIQPYPTSTKSTRPRLIKLQSSIHPTNAPFPMNLNWLNRPPPYYTTTTPRTIIHLNPDVSGSSQFNMYANSENSLNDFTVTDYSIINVAPKDQTHSAAAAAGAVPPPPLPSHYDYTAAAAAHPAHQALHSYHPPPPPVYRRNYVNSYYGSAGPPRFYPFLPPPPIPPLIPPYYNPYSQPETSIVTLTYPNSSPMGNDDNKPSTIFLTNSMNEFTSKAPSDAETITVAPQTTTPSASSFADNSTDKNLAASSDIVNSTKSRNKSTKPKDDFDSDDPEDEEIEDDENKEFNEEDDPIEEAEEEYDPEKAEFNSYTYEGDNEIANGTNDAAGETSKDENEEGNENEEPDVEYASTLNEDEVEDKNEKEEEEKEEAEDRDDKEDKDETKEKDESKEEDDQIVKPPKSAFKRYITDELDNPFAKPNFDFDSFLADLAKPIEMPGSDEKKPSPSPSTPPPKVKTKTKSHPNISRKHDRVVRLQIVDEIPQAVVKRPRVTKAGSTPGKQVVPLALVHTYKPANYSYPTNRYRLYNNYQVPYKPYETYKPQSGKPYQPPGYKPYSGGYQVHRNPNYPNQAYYDNYDYASPNQNGTDYAEDNCDPNDQACNEEEEEEYANADDGGAEEEGEGPENDDNANVKDNEEYYDDYTNDYTSDHLDNPLTKPILPSVPDRLKNIDKEVTPPPIDFDEKIKQNEEENQNEEQEEEGEEEEEPEGEQVNEENANADDPEGGEEEGAEDENQEESPDTENDENHQQSTDGEETVLSSQKLKNSKKPLKNDDDSLVDQIMIPHRQNKLLKNPTTKLNNYIPPSATKPPSSNLKQKTALKLPVAFSTQTTTYRTLPVIRTSSPVPFTSSPSKTKLSSLDLKEKAKARTNKTRTTSDSKGKGVTPALAYSSHHQTNVATDSTHYKTEHPRYSNKTTTKGNFSPKFSTNSNVDFSKSTYKITTDASRVRTQKTPSTAYW